MDAIWSIIFSGIALVVSVVSPIITLSIQNAHEYRLFRLNEGDKHLRDVIEDYVSSTARIITQKPERYESYSSYRLAYARALIYFPAKYKDRLTSINDIIVHEKNDALRDQASEELNSLCCLLREETPRLEARRKKRTRKNHIH
ncbi:MAG: hypothetical protein FWF47_06755 [Clostridia bacterium]|nr:hypothetical protein [Clostridia bacterium]